MSLYKVTIGMPRAFILAAMARLMVMEVFCGVGWSFPIFEKIQARGLPKSSIRLKVSVRSEIAWLLFDMDNAALSAG